jgi:hypothetical protein
MKTSLRPIWLSIVCLFVYCYANSQEIDFDRWEIGIDMLPLIGKNVAPPSISIKKLELKQKNNEFGLARRGFRLRAGCTMSSQEYALPFKTDTYDILFRPGYEWDRTIKGVDIFLAVDLVASFQKYYTEYYDGAALRTYKFRRASVGPSPVVGVNYKIVKNMKLSLETALDLLFTRTSRLEHYNSEVSTAIRNGFFIRLSPIYALNAVFVF